MEQPTKKYIIKQPIIEAVQWTGAGDHPDVEQYQMTTETPIECSICTIPFERHGYIPKNGHGFIVCPGDFIVPDVEDGGVKTCRMRLFEKMYELVEE